MGKKLAESYFKGHEFVIRTHTNTDNIHNHIVVNMVNFETGKMLENKKYHLYKLRDLSDKICVENGLSVINKEAKERRTRLPDNVLRMERFNRKSYLRDTMNKADFARKYATSYDEYAGILAEFNIRTRVEDENITYYYPGRNRGKRGSKLGRVYDKEGLEEAFKKNDHAFHARPELRLDLKEHLAAIKGGTLLDWAKKDYGKYTKKSRRNKEVGYASDRELRGTVVPLEEIRKARSQSILEYCKRNKIETVLNKNGETVLQGRPFVVVSEREWTNTKNKTRGSLIEFVAAHKNLSLLQAISRINNNPNLLLLEQHFGEQKRAYTSFYIPRQDTMDLPKATKRLGQFLKAFGCKGEAGSGLLQTQLAQVGKNGAIRFFPMGEAPGALEFTEDPNGTWSKRKHGTLTKPFYSARGTEKSAVIFTEPVSLIEKHGPALFPTRERRQGVLGLLEPNTDAVDSYVARNPHVKKLFVVTPENRKPSKVELDFFNNLKTKYRAFGIEVEQVSSNKVRGHEGPELSL